MRGLVVRTLGLAMVVALAGACTSDPESTIVAPSAADGSGEVTGGEIVVSGDLSAGAAATEDDVISDTSGAPPTSREADSSDPVSTPPATTRTSTPAAPTTRRPTSTATSSTTTEAPVIGDGPVLTAPTGIDASGESPGIGNGLKPVFFALEASTTVACNVADPGTVRLRWEVIGVETVDVSIGSVGNIRSADEPPAGSIDLPLDCATGTQYFVIAENPDGETIRSVSVSTG